MPARMCQGSSALTTPSLRLITGMCTIPGQQVHSGACGGVLTVQSRGKDRQVGHLRQNQEVNALAKKTAMARAFVCVCVCVCVCVWRGGDAT